MSFAWPWMIGCVIAPLLIRLLPASRPAQGATLRVPFFAQVPQNSVPTTRLGRHPVRFAVALLIWLLLVSAAMRPQHAGEPITLPQSGRDIMLLIDLSGSMDIKDMKLHGRTTDRLEVIKHIIGPFIDNRTHDRVGLILFGSAAYVQAPLSFDRGAIKQLLMEAEIGIAGPQTAIGDAMGLAIKRLTQRESPQGTMILLTDGQNNSGDVDPMQAAELASHYGLKVYTIGMGAEEMVVRDFFGQRRVNPSEDLDEPSLIEIANKTGGKYYRARSTPELGNIYTEIDQVELVTDEKNIFRPMIELYIYPLAAAAILAFLLMISTLGSLVRRSK